MAAGSQAVECPDPSVHERDHRLQDQASKAALYVTHPEYSTDTRKTIPALGPDGKLSSAGAAASLKHAQPHELPSFPSVGIDSSVSGNKAANLAHANQKPFEHWKPDLSSTAGKAALLAHKDGGKLDLWQPTASATGNTAAGAAMGRQLSPQLDYGYTEDGKKKALLAATLSVSGRSKPPPKPASPPNYPDAENASANALNAATAAHRPSSVGPQEPIRVSDPANEASRITHLGPNVNREMFTSNPKFEDEETAKQHALRGATLSVERDRANKAKEAETEPPLMGSDTQTITKNYLALQDQAHKLAQERLSKLDPDGVAAYREHYGYANSPPRSKLSVRNRRGRSASNENDEDDEEEDAAAARRIRHQMSQFNDSLADADAKKRQKDRSSVLAAAERNVRERMSTIDQDIFDQTGKVTPQMMEQWEAKARAKAAGESEKRLENHGMVHIGGGKYMDQTEITAIAQGRMQPTLDEINENAEKQRERDEQIRLAQEERKRIAAEEKQQKEDEKMQAKYEKAQEKQHYKELKDQEKEEKRLQKEQRKRQDQDWKKEQAEAKQKSRQDDETAKELDVAGAAGTYSAKASGAPAQEGGVAGEGLQREMTAGESAAVKPSAEDPPGVPTDLGQENPHTASGAFQGDSGSAARKAENDEKLEQIGVERTPTDAKKAKRESRVRSFFGKFKRNSRSVDIDASKKEPEAATVKQEDTAKPSKEAVRSSVPSTRGSAIVSGVEAPATVAVASGVVVPEASAAHETAGKDDKTHVEKKDEFHKAVTSATGNDAEGDDLYSAPSAEPKPAAATPVAEVSAEPGTPSGTWASTTQHEIEERGNSADVSRPSTAIPTHTSTTDTAATAPEQVSVRNSLATTSDEFEEARDKFDESDAHETATLKAPEPAPHRPTSKFQEELED